MHYHRGLLKFYGEVVTESFVESLLRGCGVVSRGGVYPASVAMWLMIAQWLRPDRTLRGVIKDLQESWTDPFFDRVRARSGRARAGKFSEEPSALCQARQRLPLSVVTEVSQSLNRAISESLGKQEEEGYSVYLLDGTTVRTEHTPDNLRDFPPSRNQFGEAHFPIIRVAVATNAVTGVTLHTAIGAHSGKDAVSELTLGEELLQELPKSSVVIGDRYFGCFRFVCLTHEAGLKQVFRLKVTQAHRLLGKDATGNGERALNWDASKMEREKYPQFSDKQVPGRLIWRTLKRKGFKAEKLILFTTLDCDVSTVFKLYALRWRVEGDIRYLKSTLELNHIYAKSPEMVRKEVLLGVSAYNLVRHAMCASARALKVTPREISFSQILRNINSFGMMAIRDGVSKQLEDQVAISLCNNRGLLIPKRKKKRLSEPRKYCQRGAKMFLIKTREEERQLLNKPSNRRDLITN